MPVDPQVADAEMPDSSTALAQGEFELDYSGITSEPGGPGIPGGEHRNHAFTLDLGQSRRVYTSLPPSGQKPDLVLAYDFGGCESRSGEELARSVAGLDGTSQPTWVEDFDVELQTGGEALPAGAGLCFGYRDLTGKWQWNLAPSTIAEASNGQARAKVVVNQGPITAIKIVFNKQAPRMSVQRIRFRARPDAR